MVVKFVDGKLAGVPMELGSHGDGCGVDDWFVASEFSVEVPCGAGDDSCWGSHKGPGLSGAEAFSDFAQSWR